METLLVKVAKMLPLVFSLVSVGFTALVKYQLEKAKHQFEVQAQFRLESHKKVWELWETYYNLTSKLEQVLSDCNDDLKIKYYSTYEEMVQQKRLFKPVISPRLDETLEKFLEFYHPLNICNEKTGESYQKLYSEVVNQFMEVLK